MYGLEVAGLCPDLTVDDKQNEVGSCSNKVIVSLLVVFGTFIGENLQLPPFFSNSPFRSMARALRLTRCACCTVEPAMNIETVFMTYKVELNYFTAQM